MVWQDQSLFVCAKFPSIPDPFIPLCSYGRRRLAEGKGQIGLKMNTQPDDLSRRQLIAGLLLLQSSALLVPKTTSAAESSFENVRLGRGSSSLVVPPLGIGAWSWGDEDVWGYGGYDKNFTDDSIEAAFLAAVKAGVTFFDTAEVTSHRALTAPPIGAVRQHRLFPHRTGSPHARPASHPFDRARAR